MNCTIIIDYKWTICSAEMNHLLYYYENYNINVINDDNRVSASSTEGSSFVSVTLWFHSLVDRHCFFVFYYIFYFHSLLDSYPMNDAQLHFPGPCSNVSPFISRICHDSTVQ